MLRRLIPIIALLCLVFLLTAPVFAQDSTPEATPVVGSNPPVVVYTPAPILTPDNAISISTLLYGFIIAILGGGTVGLVINRFGSNKANLDAAEKLYQSQSPDAQERERLLFEGLRSITLRVLDIVDKVTDGQPNAELSAVEAPTGITHTININGDDKEAAAKAVRSFLEAARNPPSDLVG